ncbi:uncharacterized protein LOC130051015 [Ostrea edulis]|uniref:uncharacterized protein LOC130051015 n=1 Tax=Ostrea edulis TaxID=37623 RepID=UPI0024AF4A36|nr:uncharacterized protein LOC130051015 [Ostrea edulis]
MSFFSLQYFQGKCQKLSCYPGRVLLKGKCNVFISFTGSKIYNIAFKANVRLIEGQMELDKDQLFQNIISFFTIDLFYDPGLKFHILQYYYQTDEVCREVVTLSESDSIMLTVFMKIIIWNKNWENPVNLNEVEDRLYNASLKKGSFGNFSFEYFDDVKAWFLPISGKMSPSRQFCITRLESINQYNSRPGVDITKLLFCPQISLSPHEFTPSNDGMQIFVTSLNRTFYHNEFFQDENNTVRVCASTFLDAYTSQKSGSQSGKHTDHFSLKVLTILSTSVSLISLVITFFVYCFLKKLRTIPGQNLMCFIGALFFAQLSFLLKDFFMENSNACTALGILNYYFWLSIFTCSSVCCIHMFRVFVCDSRFYDNFLCNSTIIVYSVYAYITPLLLVFISIGCHVSISPTHTTGFGGSTCFIDDKETQLYSFILPISLLCFVNFVLFSVTFHKIHSAPTMENTHCRNDLSIYLKLFLLTGTTWVFQIIDGLFPISPFSYLVTVLNGSQGFYIMISFVFNRRVKSMFEDKGVLDKLHLKKFKKSRSSGGTQLHQKITMSENVC